MAQKVTIIAKATVIIFGVFLIIDSFFLHLITFDYVTLGIEDIDSHFDHWMVGIGFVAIGVIAYAVSYSRHNQYRGRE